MKKIMLLLAMTFAVISVSAQQNMNLQRMLNKNSKKTQIKKHSDSIDSIKIEEYKEPSAEERKKDIEEYRENTLKEIATLRIQLKEISKKIEDKEAVLKTLPYDKSKEISLADSLLNAEKQKRDSCIYVIFGENKNKPFYNISDAYFQEYSKDNPYLGLVDVPRFTKCNLDSIVYYQPTYLRSKEFIYNVKLIFKTPTGKMFVVEDELNYKTKKLLSITNEDFINTDYRKKYPKVRFWELIKSGKVRIGMTKQEAKFSWGKPSDINRTTGSWGTHEQWVYDSSYLYFENGILKTIQN